MTPNRNLNWLWNRRVVTLRYPTTDNPTKAFYWGWFYKDGTHQYYHLFNKPHRINTFKSYKWHIAVIKYLNNGMSFEDFTQTCLFIKEQANGFSVIDIPNNKAMIMINDVFKNNTDLCPSNKIRKVVFKVACGLETHEKLAIVGHLIGRSKRLDVKDIISSMRFIHHSGYRVSIAKIARHFNCSRNTLYAILSDEAQEEINRLNNALNERIQRKKLRDIPKGCQGKSTDGKVVGELHKRGINSQVSANG